MIRRGTGGTRAPARAGVVLASVALASVVVAGCGARARPALLPVPLPQVRTLQEFVVPWENAFPSDIAVDSTGRVWFTDRLTHVIGMLDPATGKFRSYATPTALSAPYGLIVAPDGTLWFCESARGRLGRIDPGTGEITEYEIPGAVRGPHLLAWRAGEIWFTIRDGRGYGRFDPRSGKSEVHQLPQERPYSVAVTRDAVWMSSYGSFRLLEVDPSTAAVRVHDLEALIADTVSIVTFDDSTLERLRRRIHPGEARRIASAADGTIWFTDFARSRVVQYDPKQRAMTMFSSVERQSEPYGVALSSGGHVWYSERGGRRVTVLDPGRDERLRIPVPGGQSHARHMVLDERRGRAWLPLSDTGRIGLVEYR